MRNGAEGEKRGSRRCSFFFFLPPTVFIAPAPIGIGSAPKHKPDALL